MTRHPVLLGSSLLLASVALTVAAYSLAAFAVYRIAAASGVSALTLTEYNLVTPLSQIVSMLPLTPGGIGIGEGAFGQLCLSFAGSQPAFAYGTIYLAYRAASILATLPGLFFFLNARFRT